MLVNAVGSCRVPDITLMSLIRPSPTDSIHDAGPLGSCCLSAYAYVGATASLMLTFRESSKTYGYSTVW